MPADSGTHGAMAGMMRLVRMFSSWRRRRATRRRAYLHGFMGLSDRALADIGVRRADVSGALIGAVPLGRAVAAPEESVPDVALYELPRPRLVVANDFRTAA